MSGEPYSYYSHFNICGLCIGCGRIFAFCTCNGPKDVPLGWRCPNCGIGLAPDVKECSCVTTVTIEPDDYPIHIPSIWVKDAYRPSFYGGWFPKSRSHNFVISSKRGIIPLPEAQE